MGYVFLGIALLSGATKGFCGKKSSGFVTQFSDSLVVNLIRMLLCILISLAVLCVGGDLSALTPDRTTLAPAALSGVSTAVFVTTWLLSIRKGAMMFVDVFLMLGVLVTVILSLCLLPGESITLWQVLGFGVLFVAILLMCSYQKALKGTLTAGAVFLLLLCGTANGLTDFSQKYFIRTVTAGSLNSFQLYTYLFAALSLGIILSIIKLTELRQKAIAPTTETKSEAPRKKSRFPLILFVYILIMAVCLYLNSYFKTKAASFDYLPSSVLYPVNQGCGLLLSTAMAAIFFKEKPSVKSIVGILLAFLALLLINHSQIFS
ncbi:MAG: EamA family transporter [Clostridia bacterium]|nr:EamA family transporter [Clostridia bacterium]